MVVNDQPRSLATWDHILTTVVWFFRACSISHPNCGHCSLFLNYLSPPACDGVAKSCWSLTAHLCYHVHWHASLDPTEPGWVTLRGPRALSQPHHTVYGFLPTSRPHVLWEAPLELHLPSSNFQDVAKCLKCSICCMNMHHTYKFLNK